jgi:hypothetical protein
MGDEQAEWAENNGYDYADMNMSYACTSWAPGIGFAGITFAVVFASKLLYSFIFDVERTPK